MRGESPQTVQADDFVALRRTALEKLKTLHLSADHLVTLEGDRATARTASGWKISKAKQTVYWNTGNPDVHAGARRR